MGTIRQIWGTEQQIVLKSLVVHINQGNGATNQRTDLLRFDMKTHKNTYRPNFTQETMDTSGNILVSKSRIEISMGQQSPAILKKRWSGNKLRPWTNSKLEMLNSKIPQPK